MSTSRSHKKKACSICQTIGKRAWPYVKRLQFHVGGIAAAEDIRFCDQILNQLEASLVETPESTIMRHSKDVSPQAHPTNKLELRSTNLSENVILVRVLILKTTRSFTFRKNG